ncbi:MAG TPA: putative quinol monooxygenase [Acidimicrobiales bacterium]|nr:putative quinol monooxygenase [Acidimicrobiales bacterium]HJM28542.1 putative quinol monooxygenase [Acidimicrobiales bacterium]HJM97460.1 putative quinol monooxygenase [Acidimicrobiales bacterium]
MSLKADYFHPATLAKSSDSILFFNQTHYGESSGEAMIFIVVKFKTKPEWTEKWLELVDDFSQATRSEAGNLWFEWSQSCEDPNTFILVEAFRENGAEPHVNSEHFKRAMAEMPEALEETPKIINTNILDTDDWSLMGELSID